ncbi:MAG: exonuclease domain-containing protein [Bacteroidia bacterium]
MFAVIDIETTGTRPEKARITEIAIILHNGKQFVDRYVALLIQKHEFLLISHD